MGFWKRRPSDPVAEQMRGLERQGAGMAGLAHLAAFALVVVFSAGSLVALSGEALVHVIASAQGGHLDIPDTISIIVSTLLVIAMDTALVYAGAMVRLLRQRRADGVGIHVAVIIGVSVVEAATYTYMSWLYDRPANIALWALVIARAVSAPLMAVYLSLAQTLPVSARDILYQVELATGRGVIRDITVIAADTDAPLERKLALYRDSSVMTPEDSKRLDALIATEARTRAPIEPVELYVPDSYKIAQAAQAQALLTAPDTSPDEPNPDGPGGGVPQAIPTVKTGRGKGLSGNGSGKDTRFTIVRNPRKGSISAEERRKQRAFALLNADPTLSKTALRGKLHCKQETASGYWSAWHAAQSAEQAG